MEKVLANLREQHQQILQLLEQPNRVLELIQFVEEVHHPLEEQQLFPLIAEAPWLRQGGPQCSLHMGLRLERDPLGKMRAHLQQFYQKAAWAPQPFVNPPWLTPQLPLSIPMEEHAVSHNLAESLKYLLKNPVSDLYREFFNTLHNDFCDLLKMHIDKEDHCLFVMCEKQLKNHRNRSTPL